MFSFYRLLERQFQLSKFSWRFAPFPQDQLNLGPKISEQGHRVFVVVKSDPLPLMLVVIFDACPSSGPHPLTNGMSIIKTQQALSVTSVERHRVVQTMRFLQCGRNPFYLELNPEIALHHETLAIQEEKRIETVIVVHRFLCYHPLIIKSRKRTSESIAERRTKSSRFGV
jgi:hypothetical protein